jgi:nucleoid DNA-binding protein
MDIDLLSKMVKELILDNDRVVLPGLGSFVAEVVPSTFSDKGYTINPPYRRLYFRANPSEGMELIEFYARTNKVGHDVAERIIRDFISEMRQILHTKKTVVFPGLGRLRATKENNLFFVADEGLDIYPAGFGLEPISLKTHQETTEEVTAAVAGLKSLLDDVPQLLQSQSAQVESQEDTPGSESEPEPTSQPEPTSETQLESVSESSYQPAQDQKPISRIFLKVLLVAAGVLLLLTVTYAIVGRTFPEWIDQFLYTPEELEILNHKL